MFPSRGTEGSEDDIGRTRRRIGSGQGVARQRCRLRRQNIELPFRMRRGVPCPKVKPEPAGAPE